jgi:EpsI family protein
MDQRFINALDFTDYVQIDYQNAAGRTVDFYVAWYQSQSKGESIHSPETCLRGGGWEFVQSSPIQLNLPGHEPIRVNRALMRQGGQRMLSYFWFPARGRYLTNGVELKIYTFWDSLTKRRTDGALVRLITPIYSDESEQDGEARLYDLLLHAVPALDELLPGAEYPDPVRAE